jgi:hypothetical protein
MATINAASVEYNDVKAAVEQAVEGDTVILPAGEASWPEKLEITKGITIQGQTTVENAGTPDAIAQDLTVIRDESPRNQKTSGVFKFTLSPEQACRLTGITIKAGTATVLNNNGVVFFQSSGDAANFKMRVDHCHVQNVRDRMIHAGGWCFGVADHNLLEANASSQSCYCSHGGIGGSTSGRSDEAWTEPPMFGSGNFFFFETNTILNTAKGGAMDAEASGRYVARHNYFKDCQPNSHGTEGSRNRGTRAAMVYGNWLDSPVKAPSTMNRGGSWIYHDNRYTGLKNPGGPYHSNMVSFRQFGATSQSGGAWGSSDGTSPYDDNDPHGKYFEGTATKSEPEGTLTDNTANWTPDQWMGFSVHHPRINKGANILSNTATKITYRKYGTNDRGPLVIFNEGDLYQIYRVFQTLDQPGRGKGDLLTGDPATPKAWSNQQTEPCISWNNVYADANSETAWGFFADSPTIEDGRDYYNLGPGFDAFPAQVVRAYPASVNGLDYTQDYAYPHPLVSGEEPPIIPPEPEPQPLTVKITVEAPPEVKIEITQIES